ncbi:folate-binding protein [Oscillatoria sp. CS-180]|uniref:CAF17-like 4Fe-4S cluster assembly/insertion protein YgfZ n=1 Tax=Oscillatoria sp. CS-180 TaxID=3021720 RepID=UPI00232C229D|nr:folate-binding protein [Oscillatoria sp. CS-180]MDB9525472.1 folate-binding protein [Oscillatoria sp. CS-180]
MGNSLLDKQQEQGANFAADSQIPLSFGNDEAARIAVQSGVALCDRSHWGRIRVSDADRLQFLHNQTTNQMQLLQSGQGCDTVFVTSTGRTLDLVTAYVEADSVLLFVSPGQASELMDWMDRYIFFADKVKLTDETENTVAFTLLGTDSAALLSQLGVQEIDNAPHASHQVINIQGLEIFLGVDSGLPTPGFTLIAPVSSGADLWHTLTQAGAVPMGETLWQELRIKQGRPMPGAELTKDYNPLEATLWQAVSFDKGCYIGQETIARLNTYQGVKQQLWGLHLEAMAAAGTPITLDDAKVGVLTSCVETSSGAVGLGYIRTKAGGNGLTVTVGETTAKVVNVPFATRGYLDA